MEYRRLGKIGYLPPTLNRILFMVDDLRFSLAKSLVCIAREDSSLARLKKW
jgi:hypothetical protein